MMEKTGKKLTAKQTAALGVTLFYPVLAKVLIPITVKQAGHLAFMGPLVSALVLVVQAFLLKKLKAVFPKNSVGDILQALFGRRAAKVLLCALSLWMALSAAGYMEYYDELLTSTIYPDAKHDLMPVLMAVMVGFLLPKGLYVLGRMNWMICAVVLFQMVLITALMIPKCDLVHLLPLEGGGLAEAALSGSVTASAAGGVVFTLFLLKDQVRERPEDKKKNQRRGRWLLAGAVIVPAALMALLTAAFSGPVLIELDWPVLSVVREIFDLESSASLEPLFIATWFYADFLCVALQSYLCVKLLGEAFGLKDFKELLQAGVIFILSVTLCFSGGVEEMRVLTQAILLPIQAVVCFGLPALCVWRLGKKERPDGA